MNIEYLGINGESMYLRKAYNSKTGRTYLSIMHNYWDKEKGTSRSKTIRSLGYLDVLEQEYDDPIAHFEQVAQELNEKHKEESQPITLTLDKKEQLHPASASRKNFGYAALSCLYHELQLDTFFLNRSRHWQVEYNFNSIMRLLLFCQILDPSSKRSAFAHRDWFFERADFSLDDVYRSLTKLHPLKDDLLLHLHKNLTDQDLRDTSLVYYDVTNYYFELDQEDELRKKGVSKEHRPDPIVQMGLFTDRKGLPLSYELFSGNTPDKSTLRPILGDFHRRFTPGRVIVTADRGIITGDNISYILSGGHGYVLSHTVRGADKAFQEYVLDETGYQEIGEDGFRMKSRRVPREIWVTMTGGSKKKQLVHEKQVVFYSDTYARKAKHDRAAAVSKAKSLIENPAAYKASTSSGAAKYVQNLEFDKETGEVLTQKGKTLCFDDEKLRKEERLDGYYAIVSSEMDKSDQEILDIYRGLWQIEEAFKVTKSCLKTRPVFVTREDHIRAHFLLCFVALLMGRLLQQRLSNRFSISSIAESLRRVSCSNIGQNYYVFDYVDEVTKAIEAAFDLDFSTKYRSLAELKKSLASTKKC